MTIDEAKKRALEIRKRYAKSEKSWWGREWTAQDLALGFAGDLGDLVQLIQAKEGIRPPVEDLDAKLEHELADCFWCVLVLANEYNIDIEKTFIGTMDDLEKRLKQSTEA